IEHTRIEQAVEVLEVGPRDRGGLSGGEPRPVPGDDLAHRGQDLEQPRQRGVVRARVVDERDLARRQVVADQQDILGDEPEPIGAPGSALWPITWSQWPCVNTTAAARPRSATRSTIASSSRGKYAGSTTTALPRSERMVELVCQMPLVRMSTCTR